MNQFIENSAETLPFARAMLEKARAGLVPASAVLLESETILISPVPRPVSCRDGYAFRQHVESARKGRGLPMIPEFDHFPIFYFTNHQAVFGPGPIEVLPKHLDNLDFELESAIVIGKKCRNVSAHDADKVVFGYTIMNDLSARDLSRRPDWPRWNIDWFGHKNFDGAAPMGPWITPADQIADHTQCHLRLWVNEEKKQDTLVADLIFNVPELIEYLSRRMTLRPGDVIATGTPAGVGRPKGTFLKPGDTVRIEISGLGVLQNPVIQGQ
jgi:fumarylacetoacetate (FAA) hydrolase